MNDDVLKQCNESELLGLARNQGLGNLRRGLPREMLIAIVSGELLPTQECYSGIAFTRQKLETFIAANIEQCRSQLPGCTGKCQTFNCSDGRHACCWAPNEQVVR